MNPQTRSQKIAVALALLAVHVSGSLSAQELEPGTANAPITVIGPLPTDLSEFPAGPDIKGFISARRGDRMQVTGADGTSNTVTVGEATEIRSNGGFLGLGRNKLTTNSLLNGLPVTVRTVQWAGGLAASRIVLASKDLRTAAMIHNGTDQRFGEQAAATEALRGRLGDIDKYNIKGTTNVNFAVGKWALTPQAKADLCTAAAEAETTDNALLLVVGYTDSTGSEEFNQILSEKRASRVVNYLQQSCGWKPYRMLTPTGMAEADPVASNDTYEGKAMNRRVSVNILVSKSVDGL